MESNNPDAIVSTIAEFYNGHKFGYEGIEGYRKSTDLLKFAQCINALKGASVIDPHRTVFADLGCADGRVNVLMSYFVRLSIGIEIDPDILSEFKPRKEDLLLRLREQALTPPPENIQLFRGSSLEEETYERIFTKTSCEVTDIDLFYTYITLHDLFGEMIASRARSGAYYLVYGFSKILPQYTGLSVAIPDVASQGIAALYRKD